MLHIPFLGGLALGAGVVWLLSNKKTKEQFEKSKEFVNAKIDVAAKKAKAIKECVEEKSSNTLDKKEG